MSALLDSGNVVTLLKAAAEPTRLRILLLLAQGEFNVKDLTRILGQSQPRISRHLKLLAEAGLIERVQEGSWAYFHLSDGTPAGQIGRHILASIGGRAEGLPGRDALRAEALKKEREEIAQQFFMARAAEWDSIRSLHVEEAQVEAAMLAAMGPGPFDLLVDLGTGTGRMLELFAGRYARALGIDASHAMLSYARAKLERAGLGQALVRQGDICNLNIDDGVANAVVMHQVLHFLSQPSRAVEEAARILAPGGRLLLVDFAPHDQEFLREDFAHVRLGFAKSEIAHWLDAAGLDLKVAKDLVPPAGDGVGKVTVSIWVGELRQSARRSVPDRAITDVENAA
jgi:ubiquinone/menaquinone biosynthesis C-methylase UbiE